MLLSMAIMSHAINLFELVGGSAYVSLQHSQLLTPIDYMTGDGHGFGEGIE